MSTGINEGTSNFALGLERWESQEDFPVPAYIRGIARTRGAAIRRLPAQPLSLGPTLGRGEDRRQRPLSELVADLRSEADFLPLTITLHGWGSETAEAFVSALRPLLSESDAIWLISSQPKAPGMETGVVLDLNSPTDKRVYDNLVGDIVFFPAKEADEVELAKAWIGRARAVCVASGGQFANQIKQAAGQTEFYRWQPHALQSRG